MRPRPERRAPAVLAAILLVVGLGLSAAAGATAQQAAPPNLGRSVYGVVLDARNQPIASAVVYLKNRSTKSVRNVITDDRGGYSFHQLSPHATYELYAVWKGKRSDVRVDSQYDPQPTIRLDLKIPVV